MPSSLHQPADQRNDLGLDDGVERARRLVGDQQARPRRNRRGNRHALLLAAGELVRIGSGQRRRVGQPDPVEQFDRQPRAPPASPCRDWPAPPRRPARRRSSPDRGWPPDPGRRSRCRGRSAPVGPSPATRCCRRASPRAASSPAMASASVLLPEPLSPITASRSPASRSRSTPASASTSRPSRR